MKKIPLGKWNKRLLAVTALFAVTGICAQSTATYAHYVVSTRLPVEPIVVQTPAELTATMGGVSAPPGVDIPLGDSTFELVFSLPGHGEATCIQLTLDDKTAYGQLEPGQTMTLYIHGEYLQWNTVDAIPEDGPRFVDGMTLPMPEAQPTAGPTQEPAEQPAEQPTPEPSAEPTPTPEPTATPTATATATPTATPAATPTATSTATPMATPTPQPTETTATPTPAASEKPEGTQQPEQKTPEN